MFISFITFCFHQNSACFFFPPAGNGTLGLMHVRKAISFELNPSQFCNSLLYFYITYSLMEMETHPALKVVLKQQGT